MLLDTNKIILNTKENKCPDPILPSLYCIYLSYLLY